MMSKRWHLTSCWSSKFWASLDLLSVQLIDALLISWTVLSYVLWFKVMKSFWLTVLQLQCIEEVNWCRGLLSSCDSSFCVYHCLRTWYAAWFWIGFFFSLSFWSHFVYTWNCTTPRFKLWTHWNFLYHYCCTLLCFLFHLPSRTWHFYAGCRYLESLKLQFM